MKDDWSHIENNRVKYSPLGETPPLAHWGHFEWWRGGTRYTVIASDGAEVGWEHVSITASYRSGSGKPVTRNPTWDEMCWLKNLFWDDHECVVQFHPPKSEYVNNHPHCLHLWKWTGGNFPLPPSVLVGIKELGTLA